MQQYQHLMHAMCLDLLQDYLQPAMHTLDVDSGTGYLIVCLALMVGSLCRAVGIEHIPELVTWSIKSAASLEASALTIHVSGRRFRDLPARLKLWHCAIEGRK